MLLRLTPALSLRERETFSGKEKAAEGRDEAKHYG